MKILFYLLAFTGGIFLAIQAGFNSQLGSLLKNPVIAVISASMASAVFGLFYMFSIGKGSIQLSNFHQVPWYLWFIGGLFSMIGISLYFYTIPKLGISKMIAWGLCGQLLFSLLAGKFGWLNLPVEPLTTRRLLGAFAMVVGIVLINSK
ncbi:transporter family-2 protein [Zhouia amylolytica]|uniref:Transporter family-2 protein n=1 Tax=Zhouia amylolytica TaxID=376730 RepID=A0A1I6UM72_9FLAO|nr:DMT family transporter [Zhouia amylolytica]SFT02540.1 transporter family-2 protein [Zhouia amylolytica]